MKKFLYSLTMVLGSVIVLLYAMDYLFTCVYETSQPRNKFQYILKLKPQTIDYVFLGSSRVANHIATKEVEQLTGRKAINLGMEGAHLEDNLLQLKLLLHQGVKIKKLFLQVDYQFEDEGRSPIALSDAMPFIKHPVVKEHMQSINTPDFEANYYVPFYRYMMAAPKIGFREFFFASINKQPKIDPGEGFTPKTGNHSFGKYALPSSISETNAALEGIKKICKDHQIEVVFFCAPFCSVTENKEYIRELKTKLPELKDYSAGYEDELFYDCAHLNEKGALFFTRQLVTNELLNEEQ
ncbi:hypothetical protein [Flavobacterium saliperosum]|uniref:SGNH/GDSL hydrolase family protein n=1 Tax=Flavobacterium saliperosum TaxID=329186 RepID=A0A1G4VQV5_9FLAO|nr:hypothetical protein [Flavobacterium saliperosum]SCX09938.1 hypothetical protein SAMN02927925_01474 [Flavobacterium saliperosum]